MFAEYIAAALERAEYEMMEDEEPEPYYAYIPRSSRRVGNRQDL